MPRDRKDYFYRKAKSEGYRSRAAYKLLQINKKFNLIRKGDVIVDLGAAPGGWLQVAKEISGGTVIGVDLEEIAPIEGVFTIRADITADLAPGIIKEALPGDADVVICDAAPNLSGIWSVDHSRSIDLARSALLLAKKILRPGGNMLVKVFQGDIFPSLLSEMKREFKVVRAHSPMASRKASAEIYVMGLGRIAGPLRIGDIYDVQIVEMGRSGDGIASIDGLVVYVRDTRIGDRVRIKINAVRQGYAIGTTVDRKD